MEVWDAKNLNFSSFFEQKSKAKKHDVLEGPKKPSRRGKKQSQERLSKWEGARGEVVLAQLACWRGRGGITKNQQLVILHALGPLARRIFFGAAGASADPCDDAFSKFSSSFFEKSAQQSFRN